ncbi:MAG TPA: hypothetical protein VGE10_11745 [Zeimonas sp.]
MRTAASMLSCLAVASFAASATAEDFHRVVAGLNYRVAGGVDAELAQAVRVRPDTGKVLVRYSNARTEWVDPARLAAQPQPLATDSGPYLFVAAALACLLDRDGCARKAAAQPTAWTVSRSGRANAVGGRDGITPVRETTAAGTLR